jgi:phage baseplate assembly protein gpV
VAQIDAQGGANRLVTQINAGTGVVTRTHVVSAVVSGVVTFENIPLSPNEVSSDNIDPAFGPGAVNVEFALDDIAQSGVTSSGDLGYGRTIMLRSEDDRTTGRFRILASRQTSGAGPVKVRWFAFKPAAGSDANVAISVSVAPPVATVLKNATQNFTATVKNTNNQNVTWSLDAADGTKGTLSNVTSNSVTYTPPLVSATYNLTAKSALDPNKQAVVPIDVRADVFVTVTPGFPTVFGGSPVNLTAAAFNTSTTGVTWSIREGASGGTLTVSGNNATYTAPTAPGTYHVDAVSTADTTKQGTATISVPAVTVALNQTNVTLPGRSTLSLNATVGNAVNKGVTWSVREFGAVGFLTSTTSTSTTYNAENTPGTFHVDAVPIADPTQKATCAITILPVTFSIRADQNPLETFSSTTITATVTGASDLRANWSGSASGSVSPGPSSTTTFFAPGVGSIYTVTGTSVADPNKSETISMDVQAPGDGPGGPAGGTDGGGIILPGSPSQFLPVKEGDFLATHPASTADSAPSTDEGADTGATARSFVRPKKRSGPKRRPKPNG